MAQMPTPPDCRPGLPKDRTAMIRTTILVMIAFVAGLLYERNQMAEACLGYGGRMHDGVCWND